MKYNQSVVLFAFMLLLCACASGGDDESQERKERESAPTKFSITINEFIHDINKDQALIMTNYFGTMRDSMLIPSLRGQNVLPISETFNLAAIDKILCQSNTVAFRAYLGMEPSTHKVRLIFVGVNGEGEDIIQSGGTVTDNPAIEETGQRYP